MTVLLRVAAAAAVVLVPAAAQAAPVGGGDTRVQVTADLAGLGLTPGVLGSATIVSADPLTVNFPVTGGELDAALAGNILHNGSGVSLSGGGNTIDLTNFVIDTVAQLILGDVDLNAADFAEDLPLFSFDLASVTVEQLTDLANPALALLFTGEAAGALTAVFGAPDLTGAQFGLAATAPELAVAEPAMLALFGLGALGVAAARRRRLN